MGKNGAMPDAEDSQCMGVLRLSDCACDAPRSLYCEYFSISTSFGDSSDSIVIGTKLLGHFKLEAISVHSRAKKLTHEPRQLTVADPVTSHVFVDVQVGTTREPSTHTGLIPQQTSALHEMAAKGISGRATGHSG